METRASKMRVLLLNYEYPPLGGGAGNATYYLLKEFQNHPDLEIDLVTSSTGTSTVERLSDSICVHYLDIGKSGNIHYQANSELLTYSFRAYLYGKKLIRAKNYDLVHAFFGIPCGFIAMNLKTPYIVSLRGSDVPFYSDRYAFADKYVFQRLSRSVWNNAAAVVANSIGLRALAVKTDPNQSIGIIPNGVDTNFFSPVQDKIKSRKIRLISTGRLIARKGYDHLVRSLEGLEGFELKLVGDGNQTSELKALAKQMNVDVDFVGRKNRDELLELLKQSDIFVLPSLNEGMSNSLLEAMACGLPVIVTDAPGSEELVRENGLIVKKASADSLQDALKHYQKNPAEMTKHGHVSRQSALTMSWATVAGKYAELYWSQI